MFVEENSASIYLQGMCDRSMRSGTKFAREIQLTDWSTAGNLSNRSSGVQIPRDICTRFGRYLYSWRCSWIINRVMYHNINKLVHKHEDIENLPLEFQIRACKKTSPLIWDKNIFLLQKVTSSGHLGNGQESRQTIPQLSLMKITHYGVVLLIA